MPTLEGRGRETGGKGDVISGTDQIHNQSVSPLLATRTRTSVNCEPWTMGRTRRTGSHLLSLRCSPDAPSGVVVVQRDVVVVPVDDRGAHGDVVDDAVQPQQRVQVVELLVQRQSLLVYDLHLGS